MMVWLIERKTFLGWRIFQLLIFLTILALETVQFTAFYVYYWEQPANDQIRVWVFEALSLAIIGYILTNFGKQWKNGPSKEDVILDWVLLIIWSLQSYLNMVPAIFGKGLDCTGLTYTNFARTRCRLFIGNTVLSHLALLSTVITLMLSVSRWRSRHILSPSNRGHHRSKSSYQVQKGLLDNGEPVLFFYSKNMPPNSKFSKLRNSAIKTSEVSPSINISIPEPEIAATAKDSKDIPTYNDEKSYDSALKY